MDLIYSRRDLKIVVLVVGLFGSWVGYGAYDAHVMRGELNDLARIHMDDWFDGGEVQLDREEYDYLALVDSAKSMRWFGKGWGVIHIYICDKDDADMKSFKGIEYYYGRVNGEWVQLDSAICAAVEHHLRAFDEMLAQGIDVDDRVFDKALGIDFDYRKFLAEHEGHDHSPLPEHMRDGHEGHDHSHDHDHAHDHAEHSDSHIDSAG